VLGGLVVLARRAGVGSVLNRLALVGLVAAALGLAGRAAGEYRAAQALWGTEYGAAAAPVFGPSFPGWSDGVALSNAATVLLVIGGVVTVVALARTASAVLPVMALGLAAALTVVPPALLPGLNVGVALAAVTVGAAAARPQVGLRHEASG
jgi:hypothetical protein